MKGLSPVSWLNLALALAASLVLLIVPNFTPTPKVLFGIQFFLFAILLAACLESVRKSPRLFLLILFISVLAAIFLPAFYYTRTGLLDTRLDTVVDPEWKDALYFSIVTFTTLGYGDLAPRQEYRLVAASQALFGYLFLGLLIGTWVAIVMNAFTTAMAESTDERDE